MTDQTVFPRAPKAESTSTDAFLILLAKLFERAAFYGFHGCIIFYLLEENFLWDRHKTDEALSILGIGIIFSSLIGGLFGDLITNHKNAAILGAVFQASGMVLLCFPTDTGAYIAIVLITIGSGFFSPNISSLFAKLYTHKPKQMDAGFMWLILATNLGSFLGGLFIVTLGLENMKYAFIVCASIHLISVVFIFFLKNAYPVIDTTRKLKVPLNISMLYLILIFCVIFTFFYELSVFEFELKASFVKQYFSGEYFNTGIGIMAALHSILFLFFGIILATFWSFHYSNPLIKLTLGLLMAGLSFVLLLLIPESYSNTYFMCFVAVAALLALGETYMAPAVSGYIGRYAPLKYLATTYGSMSLFRTGINYLLVWSVTDYFYETATSTIVLLCAGAVTLLISFVIFILYKQFLTNTSESSGSSD